MRKGLIYLATNLKNNKVYIGQTLRKLDVRIDRHIKDAKYGSELIFHRAIRKHGADNFVFVILKSNIDQNLLDKYERFYIKKYNSNNENYGYNMTNGGKTYAHNIIKESQVLKIIEEIRGTSDSFKAIGNRYNLSGYAISDINRGKSWTQANIKYPIRDNGSPKRILPKTVISIKKDLISNNYRMAELSKKYSVHLSTILDINNGSIHKEKSLNYPLMQPSFLPKKILLTKEDVLNIVDTLKKETKTIKDIALDYGVSCTTISDIDKGRTWRNITQCDYPIRKKVIRKSIK